MEEVFTNIYNKMIWKGNDNTPLSGAGSSIDYNKKYIKFLQDFIQRNDISSILDIGCGDWTFTQTIDFNGKDYLGVDVVPNLILTNKSKFSKPNIKFKHLDITTNLSEVRGYDLVIFKDVLQHWNNEDIVKVLDYFTTTDLPKYILLINGKPVRKKATNRSVKNRYHYAPLSFTEYPLNKYKIEYLFKYQYKEVGLITPTLSLSEIPILYINLDRRLDRRLHITQQFKKNNLVGMRIPAIDGRSLINIEKYNLQTRYNTRPLIRQGMIGCYLSHLEALRLAIQLNLETVLIVEDDIEIISTDIPTLPEDCEIAYLGGSYWKGKEEYQIAKKGWNRIKSNNLIGAYAYIIKGQKNIQNIYNSIKLDKFKAIDIMYKNIIQPRGKSYYLNPVAILQSFKLKSDINTVYGGNNSNHAYLS